MKYYVEENLEDFKAWSGAKDTLDRLIDLDKVEEIENYINEYMENASETDINDFLWFESDYIFSELLGIEEGEN